MVKRASFILLFVVFTCVPAHADQGGYVVKPYVEMQNNTTLGPVDTKGVDATISFWDEPLWVKIAYAVQLLAVALISFKVAPIILEKVKKLRYTEKFNAVFGFISKKPGSTRSGISKETGINRDTVKYHVNNLVSTGKVVAEKAGKCSLLFPNNHELEIKGKKLLAHLNSETGSKLIYAIMESKSDGVTNVELARRLGLDKSTVHWHIDRLVEDEIVVFKKEGAHKKYYLTFDSVEVVKYYLNNDAEKAVRSLKN